jgi:hypothetical protein
MYLRAPTGANSMRNLTAEETLTLGAAIGRQAAADVLASSNRRRGAGFDASDEARELKAASTRG